MTLTFMYIVIAMSHKQQDANSVQDKEYDPELLETNELLETQSNELKSEDKKSKKSSKKSKPVYTLPDDYPLFDSPYPPPVLDGHTCRY